MIRSIPLFEGYYVDTKGTVFSDKSGDLQELSQSERKGYMRVGLRLGKRCKKTKSVHRLVLETFNPVIGSSILEVNHKNGIKKDNRLENLEWCTKSENAKHAYDLGLQHKRGEANGRSIVSECDVRRIRRLAEDGFSVAQIGMQYELHLSNIRRIIKRETWKHLEG